VNPNCKQLKGKELGHVSVRSWGTLPGSQHFRGVEGRVGASGWD